MDSLDSYEKAAQWILEVLELDPLILVIESNIFNNLINHAIHRPTYLELEANKASTSYQLVDIFKLIPNLREALKSSSFSTTFVREYGYSWIPVFSQSYIEVLNTSYLDSPNMEKWKKTRRAQISTNMQELLLLSLDTDMLVRNHAQERIKEVKCLSKK